jgi:hypothetical protein
LSHTTDLVREDRAATRRASEFSSINGILEMPFLFGTGRLPVLRLKGIASVGGLIRSQDTTDPIETLPTADQEKDPAQGYRIGR